MDVDGWGEVRTYVCSVCGEETFLGPIESFGQTPALTAAQEDAFTLMIVGDPPRCPDCRGGP
jgi:DNA-directed RNA polymerase subunit RPC12/RpoP